MKMQLHQTGLLAAGILTVTIAIPLHVDFSIDNYNSDFTVEIVSPELLDICESQSRLDLQSQCAEGREVGSGALC